MSIRARTQASLNLIERFLEQCRDPAVSISFGKDSMLMLWLVRQVDESVPVVWFDGGKFDEWPETYAFRDRVVEEWGLDLITVRPRLSLVEQWRQYGVPWKRGSREEAAYTREFQHALDSEAHRRGWGGQFVGMRAAESPTRRRLLYCRGPVYYAVTRDLFVCCPLWNWSTGDVWLATDAYGIPVHPIYTMDPARRRETVRLGTMAETCLAGTPGALATFRRRHPGLFNELAAQFPELRDHA